MTRRPLGSVWFGENSHGNIKGVTRWVGKAHLERSLVEFQYRFNPRFERAFFWPCGPPAAVSALAMPRPRLKHA